MTSPEATRLGIRDLVPGDIDTILEIERAAYSLPWSKAMFVGELRKETGLRLGATGADNAALLGYIFAAVYADVWHVMNVATAPWARRRGVASTLLEQVFALTRGNDSRGYTLEVRASNVDAQRVYERFGFRPFGMRRGYYTDDREDAIVMWKAPHAAPDDGTWAPDL